MNDLQRLYKARGISMIALGETLRINWHAVQKVVKGRRVTPYIREAIASSLGLTVEQCFGPRSGRYLRPLIECEINRKRAEYEGKLKAKFLVSPTISARRKAVND